MNNPKRSWSNAITFVVAFVAFLIATVTWTVLGGRPMNSPVAPWNIDGVFYDNIAFEMVQGNGFVVDFEAGQWRSVYVGQNGRGPEQGQYEWVMTFEGTGPTTVRSPGYPAFLAVLYQVFGWRFDVARIAGCIAVSLGLAMLIAWCFSRWGWLPSVVASTTIVVDFSIMQAAGMIASESLAILVFIAAFLSAVRVYSRPTTARCIVAGSAFALLLLTRGNWNVGLMVMGCLSLFLFLPFVRRLLSPIRPVHVLIFLVTCTTIAMPWWVRNCLVTKHFQPLGTAGSNGLAAAWCDESLEDFGNWQPDVYRDLQLRVHAGMDLSTMKLADREYLTGQASTQQALEWIGNHWVQVPQMMFYRLLSHWGLFNKRVPLPVQIANILLLLYGFVGCLFFTGNVRRVIIFVFVIDSIIVMLTWEHLGRFGVPIRPLMHVCCAIAATALIRFLVKASVTPRRE